MNENFFITKAIALAAKGKFYTKPGVNVGSVIVKNQKIIGKGYYKGYGEPHAEINAINDVKKKYKKNFLSQLSGSEYPARLLIGPRLRLVRITEYLVIQYPFVGC